MDEILAEATQLARDGVRELIVVAQDTTYYGIDRDGRPRLAELLRELEQIDVSWIRVMYFYPMYVDDALIRTLAESEKIVPYVDLPLQHIDDRMLRRMGRRVTRRETEQLIERLRRGIPRLALRTTLITGFPGETDEAFRQLADFVREQEFEHLGVFPFSNEPDTPAAEMPDQLPWEVRVERRDRLMQMQQEIVFRRNRRRIGQSLKVIVDRPMPDHAGVWIARREADAPEVDCVVVLTENQDDPLGPGAITTCEVVAVHDYDLVGAAVGKSG